MRGKSDLRLWRSWKLSQSVWGVWSLGKLCDFFVLKVRVCLSDIRLTDCVCCSRLWVLCYRTEAGLVCLFGLGFEQVFVLRAQVQRLSWRSDVALSSHFHSDTNTFSSFVKKPISFFFYNFEDFDNFFGSSEGFCVFVSKNVFVCECMWCVLLCVCVCVCVCIYAVSVCSHNL